MEAPAPPPGICLAPARPHPTPPDSPPPPAWPRSAQAAVAGLLAISLGLMGWHVWTLQRGAARPTVLTAAPGIDPGQADPEHAEEPPAPYRGGKKTPPAEPLDLNEASVAELMRLPHIGAELAQRIVAARKERPFVSVDDLRRVRGIGPKTLAGLRPHVRVGPLASGSLADRRPALP